jgi:hypothetical protein
MTTNPAQLAVSHHQPTLDDTQRDILTLPEPVR